MSAYPTTSPAESLISAPFVQVKAGFLFEKGDHILSPRGEFVPVSLSDIGRPVPEDAVVRRLAPRPAAY